MSVLVEPAPAKINLTLRVRGRRTDGLHELDSLVAFASDAADTVELQPGGPVALAVSGPRAAAIVGDNILTRTLARLQAHGLAVGTVSLSKHLPVASGIGGGSADAAAMLRAVRRANPDRANETVWLSVATELGADVPMCLASQPARVAGIGDEVSPLANFPALAAVLANPQVPVPADKTARVFRQLGLAPGELRPPHELPVESDLAFRDASALIQWLARRGNDLTEAASAVVPAVGDVLAALCQLPDCRIARMSGAGPTCFGLFDDMAAAHAAAFALQAEHPGWWVRASRLG